MIGNSISLWSLLFGSIRKTLDAFVEDKPFIGISINGYTIKNALMIFHDGVELA